jgi:hypothetical protein
MTVLQSRRCYVVSRLASRRPTLDVGQDDTDDGQHGGQAAKDDSKEQL